MPYGIPDNLWRMMSPDDQNEVINETLGRGTVPDIGGFAPPPNPPQPPPPPRTPQATSPRDVQWAWVRSLNSFPGNHPYFEADRNAGVGGYMLKADDPYLEPGAAACQAAGFLTGVWDMPKAETPEEYAARMLDAKRRTGSVAIGPDTEAGQKGYPGSPEWQYNIDAAAAFAALDPGGVLIVTPLPLQDDFNYGAWVAAGAVIWVQCYGATLDDVFDPATVVERVRANGVPLNLIGLLLPAGHIEELLPKVQAAGVTHWAIYPIDDVTSGDRAVPFGGQNGSSDGSDGLPQDLPGDYVPPPDPTDPNIPDEELDLGEGEPPDDFETNWLDEPPDIYAGLSPTTILSLTDVGPERTFAAFRGDATPNHGGLHPTLGLPGFEAIDFFATPGTRVLAPVDCVVYKFSGYDPRTGWHPAPGAAFGWSMYLRAIGYGQSEFYITHLGARFVPNGARVVRGQVIGSVGSMVGRSPHIHVGVHGGAISASELPQFDWFLVKGKGTTPLPAGPGPTIRSQTPNTEDIGTEYKRIAKFVNSGGEKRRQDLLGLSTDARKAVR